MNNLFSLVIIIMKKENLVVLSILLSGLFMTACVENQNREEIKEQSEKIVSDEDVFAGINLTVSESKRLIAKGISELPIVKNKLQKGMIIVTKGTTNTYIAEELIGQSIEHGSFLTGHFVPEGQIELNRDKEKISEIILKDGKQLDVTYVEALKMLQPGDIVFKGGNLLNYSKKQAAVCIGAPDGGTTYRFLPYIGDDKAQLIIPIGLEKETSANLEVYEDALNAGNERMNFVPKLYLYKTGMIFTEIEAIRQFADVKVFPYGVGGVAGREGGVSLVVAGTKDEVEKVLELVKSIQGENPF